MLEFFLEMFDLEMIEFVVSSEILGLGNMRNFIFFGDTTFVDDT